jgi:hypothetical protein
MTTSFRFPCEWLCSGTLNWPGAAVPPSNFFTYHVLRLVRPDLVAALGNKPRMRYFPETALVHLEPSDPSLGCPWRLPEQIGNCLPRKSLKPIVISLKHLVEKATLVTGAGRDLGKSYR